MNLGSNPPTSCADFHPFRWEDAEEPFDALREMRTKCPVAEMRWPPLPEAKLITKYDDLGTIFRNWRSFHNIGISIDVAAWRAVPPERQSIIASNPPFHGPKRRLMLKAVAPGPVDRAGPALADFAKQTVDRFAGRGEAEMIAEWAKVIPSAGIAMVLGLPVEDCQRHGEWTTEIVLNASRSSPSHPEFGQVPSVVGYTDGEAPFAYLQDHIGKRRRGEVAVDDGMSAMIEAVHPQTGETYTDLEIIEAVNTMLAAGNETTTSLMGNLLWRLAQRPDLYALLRKDRSLIKPAVEESLRLDPPQQIFERVCVQATEIHGVPISEGEAVILSLASGNRDEDVFGDDVDEFRLDRQLPSPPNWSMGGGIHLCVGSYLARVSAEAGLNALFDRVPSISLAPGFKYHKTEFHHFRGPRRLDVVFPT